MTTSNLVPKLITDKNGVQRTVHVSPEKAAWTDKQKARIRTLARKKVEDQERERLLDKCAFPHTARLIWRGEAPNDSTDVTLDEWTEKATPSDIHRIIQMRNEWDEPVLDDAKAYEVIATAWYDRDDSRYYIMDNIKRSDAFMRELGDSRVVLEVLSDERNFPDVLAVDPSGCGCTECQIGEYVPLQKWWDNATAADVAAFITGGINDNTNYGAFDVIMGPYSDRGVYRMTDNLEEDIVRAARHVLDSADHAISSTWGD